VNVGGKQRPEGAGRGRQRQAGAGRRTGSKARRRRDVNPKKKVARSRSGRAAPTPRRCPGPRARRSPSAGPPAAPTHQPRVTAFLLVLGNPVYVGIGTEPGTASLRIQRKELGWGGVASERTRRAAPRLVAQRGRTERECGRRVPVGGCRSASWASRRVAAADATPVAAEATPVAADATPVAADATPVAADATPVAGRAGS
jgi:hypothetical protein